MCAEMQHEIYQLIDKKTDTLPEEIKNFMSVAGKRLLQSVKKDEIANFLGYFGSITKDRLNTNVDDRDVTIYNNAVRGRHKVAHVVSGTQITFEELKQASECASKILSTVELALDI